MRRPTVRRCQRLRDTPIGLWCGRDDHLYDEVNAIPTRPVAGSYTTGRHVALACVGIGGDDFGVAGTVTVGQRAVDGDDGQVDSLRSWV
jgi:hypothetical protein